MKYKTAFRIALRGLGVYLIVTALPAVGHLAGYLMEFLLNGFPSGWALGYGLQLVIQVSIGIYLLRGGEWIVSLVIPSNRPYCHECGYELTGLAAEGLCPECGTAFRRAPTSSPTAEDPPPGTV